MKLGDQSQGRWQGHRGKGERVRAQQGKANGDGGEKRLTSLRAQGREEKETGIGVARESKFRRS